MPYDYPDVVPGDAYINTDRESYALGEEVTFSFGAANANGLYIPIDINGKRADLKLNAVPNLKIDAI